MTQSFAARLKKSGSLSPVLLESLLRSVGDEDEALFKAVLSQGLLSRTDASEMWASSLGVAYVNPLLTSLQCSLKEVFPVEVAQKAKAICLYKMGEAVSVAMAHPDDSKLIRSLERILGAKVSPLFSLEEDIEGAIRLFYESEAVYNESLEAALGVTLIDEDDPEVIAALSSSNSVVTLLDGLILSAINKKASDIHFECSDSISLIRFRVDGKLRTVSKIPHRLHKALCVRLKVLSDLNITENRQPQDGRFSLKLGHISQQFRLSFLPGLHGEKVVLRSLGASTAKSVANLSDLMMSKDTLDSVKRVITSPNGIFIVTGPTGSGKTSTLYSAIDYINKPDVNISTIEDPVEFQLDGVNHFQVNHKIGLDFSRVMRAMLRQDPDVILVGEIRDQETAKIATEAALTGHLVLTTLHTNNALQAVIRLIDMGVESYLVAPSIVGVMAQRLLRRICPLCKSQYNPSKELLSQYFDDESFPEITLYRGRGCEVCSGTGYQGRVAIVEMVEINEEVRSLIAEDAAYIDILRAARHAGFKSMRYDALQKVLLGITTLEEVERGTVCDFDS